MKVDRQKVFNKYGGRCAYCGVIIVIDKMHIDHIRPKHNFYNGRIDKVPNYHHNDFINLNPSCATCNITKHTMTLQEFREHIENRIKQLNKNNSVYRFAKRYNLIIEKPRKIKFYFEEIDN